MKSDKTIWGELWNFLQNYLSRKQKISDIRPQGTEALHTPDVTESLPIN